MIYYQKKHPIENDIFLPTRNIFTTNIYLYLRQTYIFNIRLNVSSDPIWRQTSKNVRTNGIQNTTRPQNTRSPVTVLEIQEIFSFLYRYTRRISIFFFLSFDNFRGYSSAGNKLRHLFSNPLYRRIYYKRYKIEKEKSDEK